MAVSIEHPFGGEQTLDTHGTAGMNAGRTDAGLGSWNDENGKNRVSTNFSGSAFRAEGFDCGGWGSESSKRNTKFKRILQFFGEHTL